MTEALVTWVHYGGNMTNVPSRRVDANVDSTASSNPRCTVTRYQDNEGNLLVGYADFHYVDEPEKPGYSYYVPRLDTNEPIRRIRPGYDIMSVNPLWTLAWVPYKARDPLPRGAVEGGYITDVGTTYIALVYRAGAGSFKIGQYVAGHSVAYYVFYGAKTATEFWILVRI